MHRPAVVSLVLTCVLAGQTAGQSPPEPAPPPDPPAAPAQPAAEDGYVEYGTHDLEKLLGTRPGPDGKVTRFVDMQVVRAIFDDLAAHARNYPTTFRSDEERARARRDANGLGGLLDAVTQTADAPVEMLVLAGRVHAMAHNLDVPQAAERATACFERVLASRPEDAQANFHFGVFLAATGSRPDDAVACLEKATTLGVVDAWFSLGMLHLTLGDRERGLSCLETYSTKVPGDVQARELLEGLRAGTLEFEAKRY